MNFIYLVVKKMVRDQLENTKGKVQKVGGKQSSAVSKGPTTIK